MTAFLSTVGNGQQFLTSQGVVLAGGTYEGPCVIEIKAGAKHKITALTDITWFCIHATDETDPSKVDRVLIKEN